MEKLAPPKSRMTFVCECGLDYRHSLAKTFEFAAPAKETFYIGSKKMGLILLLVVLVLLFGGGGFYLGPPFHYAGGGISTILVIVIIVLLLRG
jgi:hypothetical protein